MGSCLYSITVSNIFVVIHSGRRRG